MGKVLVLLVALSVLPSVPATTGVSGTPPSATPTPSHWRTIVGEIVSIDQPAGTVVVAESIKTTAGRGGTRKRETVRLTLNAETHLLRGKTPTSLSELRPKDHVVVRYRLTPQGALAVTFRAADPVNPRPTSSAAEPASAVGAGGNE